MSVTLAPVSPGHRSRNLSRTKSEVHHFSAKQRIWHLLLFLRFCPIVALSQAITEASGEDRAHPAVSPYVLCILAPVSGLGRDLARKDVGVPVNCSENPLGGALGSPGLLSRDRHLPFWTCYSWSLVCVTWHLSDTCTCSSLLLRSPL